MTQHAKTPHPRFGRSALFLLSLSVALAVHAKDKKIEPEELISRHLESVGPAEARQKLESRIYTGQGIWRVLVGGTGQVPGQVTFVSTKDRLDLRFDTGSNPTFYGELFSFDGKSVHGKQAFQGGALRLRRLHANQ